MDRWHKYCPRCDEVTERYFNGNCKPCGRIRSKEYYKKNKEKINAQRKKVRKPKKESKRTTDTATVRRRKLLDLFGDRCHVCKEWYHYCVYEFHHVDPTTKEKALSQMLTYSWERILEEAAKCILVCANCHKLAHYVMNRDGIANWEEVVAKDMAMYAFISPEEVERLYDYERRKAS
jgi:hypothetical protein